MRWLILIALVAACGDDNKGKPKDGGGMGSDGGTVIDGGSDGGTQNPFAYCIDRPDQSYSLVPRPPTAGLPCDMLPPAALH